MTPSPDPIAGSTGAAAAGTAVPRLALRGITKRYPAVVANDGVDLSVQPGEIHAVLGENGAGKSTLMKIIYGAVQADAGQMLWNGQPVQVRSPAQARALGIAMVYQHFSLFDTLTVAENVWLGLDTPETLAQVGVRIERVSAEYGIPVEPRRPVHTLSVGERQRVEIVRALLTEPQLLILDEPTSVLTPQAVLALFETLRKLAARGCSILYISHKLDEIRALCQACTVLRAGRNTGEADPRTASNAELARLMIGAEPQVARRAARTHGQVALEVRNLSLPRSSPYGTDLHDLSLTVHAGEILGLAGVSGNGQQELMAALAGEDRRVPAHAVRLFGMGIGELSPAERRLKGMGLHFIPEERLGRGAVPSMSLADNTLLTRTELLGRFGWRRPRATHALASSIIERFRVKAHGPQATARSLSGGNLQKFMVGREVSAQPRVLLVAQPTWGVDVGAAAQIRTELLALREAGCAILMVSEELEELFDLSDRMVVIARGRMSPTVATDSVDAQTIGLWMSGLWDAPPAAEPWRAASGVAA